MILKLDVCSIRIHIFHLIKNPKKNSNRKKNPALWFVFLFIVINLFNTQNRCEPRSKLTPPPSHSLLSDGKSATIGQIGPGGANDPLRNLLSGDRATSAPSTAQLQQQQAAGRDAASGQRRLFEVVEAPADRHDDAPDDYYISDLYNQLTQVLIEPNTVQLFLPIFYSYL